jgi:hypothetical protein
MAVLSASQLRDLAASVGFPDPTLAAAVAMGESYGHSDAENFVTPSQAAARGQGPEWSLGIWQINNCTHWSGDACASQTYDKASLLDPTFNARVAFSLSQGGANWRPWGAYTNGSYRQFLPASYVPYIPQAPTPGRPTPPPRPVIAPTTPPSGGPAVLAALGVVALTAAAGLVAREALTRMRGG